MPAFSGRVNLEWRTTVAEHSSLVEAIDQYVTLKSWEAAGDPVRKVRLEEGVIKWRPKPIPEWVVERKS